MHVKNKKRNSFDYYEGEITGLSDSEKDIVKKLLEMMMMWLQVILLLN